MDPETLAKIAATQSPEDWKKMAEDPANHNNLLSIGRSMHMLASELALCGEYFENRAMPQTHDFALKNAQKFLGRVRKALGFNR